MNLSQYIEASGTTQASFAERIGCEQPTVARFCAGRVPSPELMKKIIEETGGLVTPNDFFGLAASGPPSMSDISDSTTGAA